MIRLKTIAFVVLLTIAPSVQGHHDQQIELKDGLNYVSIIVLSGGNTVAELFPDAPAGTLVSKFDNARGYAVSQAYSNGWSNPTLILAPRETAIMMPPRNRTYAAHLEGVRAYPLPVIYHGWNLLPIQAFFPQPPVTEKMIPKNEDEIWAPLGGAFALSIYGAEQQIWPGLRFPTDGMWYYARNWPTNPAGEFELRGAIYFNNFAPAFGVDEPFLDGNGCPLDGEATLLRQGPSGDWIPLGQPAPVASGYIDARRDLMRYFKQENELEAMTLAVSFVSQNGTTRTGPVTVFPWKGLYPVGLTGLQATHRPSFLSNPASAIVPAGSAFELRAIYAYRTTLETQSTHSLDSVEGCVSAEGSCPVRYQWQRLNWEQKWQDVPSATATGLRFENMEEADYGTFRLKAAWGCREDFSAAATILRPINLNCALFPATGGFEVRLSATGAKQVEIQLSPDLIHWQTHAIQKEPTNSWSISVPSAATKIFFRAVAIP